MLRSINFCVHDNDDDTTDHFTPCAYAGGNKKDVVKFYVGRGSRNIIPMYTSKGCICICYSGPGKDLVHFS